MKKLMIQK